MDELETVKPKYKRVLLKLSGEAMGGADGRGLDPGLLLRFGAEIVAARSLGIDIAVVVGGGNFFRGKMAEDLGIERETGDTMGMVATVLNAIALSSTLKNRGLDTRVMSAIEMKSVAEPYIRGRAIRHLEKGRVVIFAAGSGNPLSTTDTAAVLRGREIRANVVMKATNVNGIYDKDPRFHADAKMYRRLSFHEAFTRKLEVMDMTAMTMGDEGNLPILVFSLKEDQSVTRALKGDDVGTLVSRSPEIVMAD